MGPAFVVLQLLKQLGIFQAIQAALPQQQAVALLNIVVEGVTASKPLSVMAQQRLFAKESVSFLPGMPETPALKTWYATLTMLEKNREHP